MHVILRCQRCIKMFKRCYLLKWFIHSLTPWCRVLLEKITGLQLVKKFPAFHGTRGSITLLTSLRHLSLSWASPIQSIYPHPTSWRSILIHPSTPRSPQWSLSLRFPHQNPILPLSSPIRATCPAHHILLDQGSTWQMIYYLSLYCKFVLHSVQRTRTYT